MPQTIFFTADTHFHHYNMAVRFRQGGWTDTEGMTETLIQNWNEKVKMGDRVYHLGDFSFGNRDQCQEVLTRLNGLIHVIRGNHDQTLDRVVRDNPELVESYDPYKEIKIGTQRLVLFHFPILSWHQMHYGSWHLHGHCHGNLKFDNGPMLDVGVDCHDFAPIAYEEVQDLLRDRKVPSHDHHV